MDRTVSDYAKQVVSLITTAVLLIAVILITLTAAGYKWPQAPREYPTKNPNIMWRIP
jgi:hypothetical protein